LLVCVVQMYHKAEAFLHKMAARANKFTHSCAKWLT
jgi:hypothetical protein